MDLVYIPLSINVFYHLQYTLTGVVEANSNEDLKGLTLSDLDFLGVEKPPSEVVVLGSKIPDSNITYEASTMRLRVNIAHQLNINFEIILKNIWLYEVNMK